MSAARQTDTIVIKLIGRVPLALTPQVWSRQLSALAPMPEGCRFTFDPEARDYDWLVVYDDLPPMPSGPASGRKEVLACSEDHTLLITSEPSSVRIYGRTFLRQFRYVLSSQEPWAIRHPGHIHTQGGLRWYYGLTDSRMLQFDDMAAHPPLEKSRVVSTVCSSKRQRHTLHNTRFEFTRYLSARLPELEVFGHGVRDMVDKAEALDAYKYHVAIENHVALHHWTEKLSDAFLGCTLPFYYGAPNASAYFPEQSFIAIDIRRPDEAVEIIREAIATGEYERRLPHILEARSLVLERYGLLPWVAHHVRERHRPATAGAGAVIRSSRGVRKLTPLAAMADLAFKVNVQLSNRWHGQSA